MPQQRPDRRLAILRSLVQGYHEALTPIEEFGIRGGLQLFHDELGGLHLNPDEAHRLWEAVAELKKLTFPGHVTGAYPISDSYIRKHLDETIMKCVLGSDPTELSERIMKYGTALLERLDQTPVSTLVVMGICGGELEESHFEFGGAVLRKVDDAYLAELNERIGQIVDRSADSDDNKSYFKKSQGERAQEYFTGKLAMELYQEAVDSEAAESLAVASRATVLNCLNILGTFNPWTRHGNSILYTDGGLNRTWSLTLVMNDRGATFPHRAEGPLVPMKIPSSLTGHPMQVSLMPRLSDLSAKRDPTELESRVLRAISNAAIASRIADPVQAVAWYVSALEVLCVFNKKMEGTTEQFRRHVTTLISPFIRSPDATCAEVNELYDLRSRIVHDGEPTVPAKDLELSSMYFRLVLYRILTQEPFSVMTKITELRSWLKKNRIDDCVQSN